MAHTANSLQDAFRYLFPGEVQALKDLARSLPADPVVLNIGAGSGTSSLAFLEARPDLHLITIDITAEDSPFGSLTAERRVVEEAGFSLDRLTQIHGRSQDVAKTWAGGLIDLVLVDGDHEYFACKEDILGWLSHIRPGGILAVHDYNKEKAYKRPGLPAHIPHPLPWRGVDRAVRKFLLGKYEQVALVDTLIAFRVNVSRATWVVCCGMRRSASTLQYHIVSELLGPERSLGWVTWQDFDRLTQNHDARFGDGFLVAKSHTYLPSHSQAAQELLESGRLKGIYIYRDIRDVVVSMKRMAAQMSNLNTDLTAELVSILTNGRLWTENVPCLVSRYEDVVVNLPGEVKSIASFLGIGASEEQCAEIAGRLSPAKQRERLPAVGWDSKTLFWPEHVGPLVPGQWRDGLTAEESAVIEQVAGDWLREKEYK